jgi:transposase InsO family protein
VDQESQAISRRPRRSFTDEFRAECGERFETDEEAEARTFDHIEAFYNRQRRHSALGHVSPAEYERAVQAELVA